MRFALDAKRAFTMGCGGCLHMKEEGDWYLILMNGQSMDGLASLDGVCLLESQESPLSRFRGNRFS